MKEKFIALFLISIFLISITGFATYADAQRRGGGKRGEPIGKTSEKFDPISFLILASLVLSILSLFGIIVFCSYKLFLAPNEYFEDGY